MINKELKNIRCKNGLIAKGIIFRSCANDVNPIGLVYLPGSVLGSTAVHRLGIDICRYVADKGFKSSIFDHTRIGESEGELPAGSNEQLGLEYIVKGDFVGDTIEAIDQFVKATNVRKVVLIGHCAGGITALYAAASSVAVVGAMLISTPLSVLWEGRVDIAASAGAVREYSTLYKNKLKSVEAWKKLLSGKSDYRLLLKFIKNKIRKIVTKESHGKKLIRKYKESLDNVKSCKTIVFIMGDKDSGMEDFKYFANTYLKPDQYSIWPKASHGFVDKESIGLLFGEIDKFMRSFNQ